MNVGLTIIRPISYKDDILSVPRLVLKVELVLLCFQTKHVHVLAGTEQPRHQVSARFWVSHRTGVQAYAPFSS